MKSHVGVLVISTMLTAMAVGCSPSGTGPRVPPGGPNIGAPRIPWHDKSREEKQAFMGAHVEPTMRKLFQRYSPKGYADFGCTTCHGSDMDLVDFKMPNGIYPLPEKDTIAEATSYDEATTKFMVEQVVPTFAGLLSEHAGKPGESGVTCFTCHPHE